MMKKQKPIEQVIASAVDKHLRTNMDDIVDNAYCNGELDSAMRPILAKYTKQWLKDNPKKVNAEIKKILGDAIEDLITELKTGTKTGT